MNGKNPSILKIACLCATLLLVAAMVSAGMSLAQDGDLVWSFNQADDPENDGRSTAHLSFSIPETDAVLVHGTCDAGAVGGFSVLHLGADIGALAESARVEVRFSGGGEEHTLKGVVHGTQAEEGITGVRINIDNDDPLWSMMQSREEISYQVPGYAATSLRLDGGRDAITRFLGACRAYASGLAEATDDADEASPPANGVISEKEAFLAARDLGTVEAWRAFLDNFPTGFRADLARAYIKELGGKTATQQPQQQQPQQQQPSPMPQEQTVDLGPGTSSWRNVNLELDEGNRSAYAAAVDSNGLEFVAYCTPKKEVGALVRQSRPGVYPDFDGRVERGLKAALGTFQDFENAHIPLQFDNGNQYYVTASVMGLTGELSLTHSDEGFRSNGRIVQDIMARSTMTLSAPPFSATFQLKGSRASMCAMLKRCGVTVSGCRPPAPPVTSNRSRCDAGSVWLEGQCVRHRDVVAFCGPGYQRQGSRCVSRYANDEPACPSGLIWEVDRCVEDD